MTKPNNSGQWKLAGVGSALVFSSGLVFIGNRKPKGLHLNNVVEIFTEHPRGGYYEMKVPRRVTLGEAVEHNFDDLGKEKLMSSSLDFYRTQHERDFPKLPQNGGQLLTKKFKSRPRKVG